MAEPSDALKSLLFDIRQHPAFAELQRTVETPKLPEYKKGDTLEALGAMTVFASGQLRQHKSWLMVLTGKEEAQQE